MAVEELLKLGREALFLTLLVSAPMLSVSVLVGLVISFLQATTQIHEQTLTFVPKIVAVLIAILVFGGWMLRMVVEFAARVFARIPGIG
ncbi:MAG: flagellar biosynthesis protein FliQ [Firmicutes bacterium]|nr:flagellar biosynthesis protein FliQ [Candidatus Fermentithermobacillaceae bacterium]